MIKTLKGLVISANDFREKDVILTILLEDDRLKSLIVKGAKTMTSHSRAAILPYTLCEFVFDDSEVKDLAILKSAHLIKSYFSTSDLYQNAALALIGELTWRIEERDVLSFDLTQVCFDLCKENAILAPTFYLAQLLKALGLSPMVDHCVICDELKVVGLNNHEGGFVCHKHALKTDCLAVERLKKFRLLNRCPPDQVALIKKQDFDFSDFLLEAEFFFYHVDLKLKAYDFFKSLFK